MRAHTDRLADDFVDSAFELHRRRLWEEVPDEAVFLVRVPTEELPLAVHVVGGRGSDYGLAIARGEGAFRRTAAEYLDSPATEEFIDAGDMMTVTFVSWSALPDPVRQRLQESGIREPSGHVVPVPFVKPPYQHTLPAGRGDLRTLLCVLRGVLAAHDAGHLHASVLPTLDVDRRRVLRLEVEGTPHAPTVTARIVPWPADADKLDLPPLIALPSNLSELPRLEQRWLVTQIHITAEMRGDPRTMAGVFIADEGASLVLGQAIAMGDELDPIIAGLVDTFRGDGIVKRRGLPREVIFDNARLHSALAPALAGLDIEAVLDPAHPPIRTLAYELQATAAALAPAELQVPGTLGEWKNLDRRLVGSLINEVLENDRATTKAMRRYFGRSVNPNDVFERMEQDEPFGAMIEWLAADYRTKSRVMKVSRTMVEKRLASDSLDASERVLLEARRTAVLSIFRVDSREPGATVEVEDVLSGERYTLYDQEMSGVELEGCFLPLRLLRVHDWIFPVPAGPLLAPLEVQDALVELESCGARLSPETMRRDAHLLGRLWRWLMADEGRHPAFQHLDGEPFQLQTATFRYADRPALERALAEREDVTYEASAGEWLWHDHAEDPEGDDDVLGFLMVHDDRLALEVTASSRLERARRWLESVPGVRFEGSEVHEWETLDSPDDERLPGPRPEPLSPKETETLVHSTRVRYRAWLDERVPSLGDKTPRQACATEEGRARVARLVRTLPAIATPNGLIDVPRADLLQELRIEPGG